MYDPVPQRQIAWFDFDIQFYTTLFVTMVWAVVGPGLFRDEPQSHFCHRSYFYKWCGLHWTPDAGCGHGVRTLPSRTHLYVVINHSWKAFLLRFFLKSVTKYVRDVSPDLLQCLHHSDGAGSHEPPCMHTCSWLLSACRAHAWKPDRVLSLGPACGRVWIISLRRRLLFRSPRETRWKE
jgi:hypothetical protein